MFLKPFTCRVVGFLAGSVFSWVLVDGPYLFVQCVFMLTGPVQHRAAAAHSITCTLASAACTEPTADLSQTPCLGLIARHTPRKNSRHVESMGRLVNAVLQLGERVRPCSLSVIVCVQHPHPHTRTTVSPQLNLMFSKEDGISPLMFLYLAKSFNFLLVLTLLNNLFDTFYCF